MPIAARPNEPNEGQGRAHDPAQARDVSNWATLLLRSVKTCRLYDTANPNVTRFRAELAEATSRLLDRCGTLRLEVKPAALEWEGQPVFQPQSRDDNLAGVLHRDGVRTLTLLPGMAPKEVQGLLDSILHVTGPTPLDDDLVTMLWEADLPHVQIASVPLEGDLDDAGEGEDGGHAPGLPWPGEREPAGAPRVRTSPSAGLVTRSDDWEMEEGAADPETIFEELDAGSAEHVKRLRHDLDERRHTRLLADATSLVADAFEAGATAADRAEIGAFASRILFEAIGRGEWLVALEALALWRSGEPGAPEADFFEKLRDASCSATAQAVAALDRQGEEALEPFLELARSFGPAAAPWLMSVLAECEHLRVRGPLAKLLGELVRDAPEVLQPWLSDARWYVVRNVVHIYSMVGAKALGLVRAVLAHPEVRVRREVIEVLARAEPGVARPMLLSMLEEAESRLVVPIVQKLASDSHPDITTRLLALFVSPAFEKRADEERRAILLALATRGNAALPVLDQALQRGGLLATGDDARRQEVAYCIARIGTAEALDALQRGARSLKPGVRRASVMALNARGPGHA